MLRAGKLKKRIKFQQKGTTQDAIGGVPNQWTDVDIATTDNTIGASIEPLSGRDLIAAQAGHSEVTHRICCRWQPALPDTVAMGALRIIYGTRTFPILFARNILEANREIEIMAKEIR